MGEEETIETIIESPNEPLERPVSEPTESFDSESRASAIAVLTDRRLLLDPASIDGTEGRPASVPYREITELTVDNIHDPRLLEVTARTGTTWRIGVAPSSTSAAKYGFRLVEKAMNLFEQIEDVRETVTGARTRLVDPVQNGNWSQAKAAYEDLRSTIDRADVGVTHSPFDGVEEFCGPLERASQRLETAYVEASLVRVEKLYSIGQDWLEDGDIDRGTRAIETARESLDTAEQRVASHGITIEGEDHSAGNLAIRLDSILSPSPIREAESIEDAIERAHSRIDTLAHSPLEQADRERERATETATPTDALPPLERAFERYRTLLDIVWRDEETFGIDRERLQERVENTVSELIGAHRKIAESARDRGGQALEDGNTLNAGDAYRTAAHHYQEAHALAKVYRAGDPEPIAQAIEDVQSARRHIPVRPTLRDQ